MLTLCSSPNPSPNVPVNSIYSGQNPISRQLLGHLHLSHTSDFGRSPQFWPLNLPENVFSSGQNSQKPNPLTTKAKIQRLAGDLRSFHSPDSSHSSEFSAALHALALKSGHLSDLSIATTLINLYSKNSSNLHYVLQLFDEIPCPDLFCYTSTISSLTRLGHGLKAVSLFKCMVSTGLKPDAHAFTATAEACMACGQATQRQAMAMQVHARASKEGFLRDEYVLGSLVKVYVRTGGAWSMHVAAGLSGRIRVLWNLLVSGVVDDRQKMVFLRKMQELGCGVDEVTVLLMLKACKGFRATNATKEVHAMIIRQGFCSLEIQTSLAHTYGDCSQVTLATRVYTFMTTMDLVSWSSIMATYTKNGHALEGLNCLRSLIPMQQTLDAIAISTILPMICQLGFSKLGQELHAMAFRTLIEPETLVKNSLIDMYSKLGDIDSAIRVFESMGGDDRDVVTWNVMIYALGVHGRGRKALGVFAEMLGVGRVRPNSSTLVSVLSACSHGGLVDEAQFWFDEMGPRFGVCAQDQHYGCMVGALARAKRVHEVREWARAMPEWVGSGAWGSVLEAGRVAGDIGVCEEAVERLFELERDNAANYVVMAEVYARAGRWGDVRRVRGLIRERGVKKPAGQSWVQCGHGVYGFVSRDSCD
ncbi:hypothetical protein AMTRI_Chr07g75270 [Amborella trichopoda]